MDYQKKKLLTQSVGFLQANLMLTSDMLASLKKGSVLTAEEVSTIQKDDTSSGKVLELICLLKRKDNRTYTRFLEVLDQRDCSAVIKILKSKMGASDVLSPDPRTVGLLETYLRDFTVNKKVMDDLAVNLVLKEIHQDELNALQEKLSSLQRQLKARSLLHSEKSSSSLESDCGGEPARSSSTAQRDAPAAEPAAAVFQDPSGGSNRGGGGGSSRTPKWDVPTQLQELQSIIHQKDDLIRRRDDEYAKLKQILGDTQSDLQSVLDLNAQYLGIISQMNQMQIATAATPRMTDNTEMVLELEQQLQESQTKIEQLQSDLGIVSEELETKGSELDKALQREKRYKERLGLDSTACEEDITERIQEIVNDGTMRRDEAKRIKTELDKMKNNRNSLEEQLMTLSKEKDKIEFHLRQQDLTIKRMKRVRTGKDMIQRAESVLAAHGFEAPGRGALKLPSVCTVAHIGLTPKPQRASVQQYCMFCRQEFQPMKSQACRVHFRPIRTGKWACCSDDCHRSAGCLQVPHFYIEITVDKKIFLTDGARYMELV